LFSFTANTARYGNDHVPGANVVARKKKRDSSWSFDPGQDKNDLIDLLKGFWIPLLEQALNQARRLLEKLEREP
jgi:hypothetical protein